MILPSERRVHHRFGKRCLCRREIAKQQHRLGLGGRMPIGRFATPDAGLHQCQHLIGQRPHMLALPGKERHGRGVDQRIAVGRPCGGICIGLGRLEEQPGPRLATLPARPILEEAAFEG